MPTPHPVPNLKIPPSQHTVSVSIINTTSYVSNIPVAYFMQPPVPGFDKFSVPCHSLLIKHNHPEQRIRKAGFQAEVEKHVAELLIKNGEKPEDVGGIIWSHHHWDHTGDPSTFPLSTDLIVGPGFEDHFVPGLPNAPEAGVHESAFSKRHLREIEFGSLNDGRKIGQFKAVDVFGDGSFYLLESPGHAIGHMCGLARTKPGPNPEFIIMGSDVAHHGGEFRPTEYLPLPESISPNPLTAPYTKTASVCPGAMFEAIHSGRSATEPFMWPEGAVHHNAAQLVESRDKWTEFDVQENTFAVTAHDSNLLDVIDFYPKLANS